MKTKTEKRKAVTMRLWDVPYRVTYDGWTQVEAATAEEAVAKVNSGEFDDSGAERVDWEANGPAKEIG